MVLKGTSWSSGDKRTEKGVCENAIIKPIILHASLHFLKTIQNLKLFRGISGRRESGVDAIQMHAIYT